MEDGHHLQRAMSVGEHETGRGRVQEVDAAEHQRVEEVEHVELVDQRVRQRHEGLDDAAFRGRRPLADLSHGAHAGRSSLDPEAAGDDVGRDIRQPAVVGERVRPET